MLRIMPPICFALCSNMLPQGRIIELIIKRMIIIMIIMIIIYKYN